MTALRPRCVIPGVYESNLVDRLCRFATSWSIFLTYVCDRSAVFHWVGHGCER